ncbi:hypothetical protein ACNI65_16160 [Roseateles sp. So40a]|uniref:hypothetical protein n=1 Tax=Roseateles sp. So40a TaxID=3400226 RepID=UPI003A8777C6
MKRFLEDKKIIVPADVIRLAEIDSSIKPVKVGGTKAQAVLHTVSFVIKNPNDASQSSYVGKPLVGALGYVAESPLAWVDSSKSPRGAYNLNCAWYLNFAVAAGAPVVNLKVDASSALDKKQSMMVARASVFSPVAIALYPNISPAGVLPQSSSVRADILWAIVAEAGLVSGVSGATEAVVARELDMLWYASSSSSSMQGKADISGDSALGAGVVSVRTSGDASTSVAYRASFDSFDTYIIGDVLDPVKRNISKIVDDLKYLINNARHDPPVRIGSGYDVLFRSLPPKACSAAWVVEDQSNGQPSQVNVQVERGATADGGCKVSLYPATAVDSEKSVKLSSLPDFGPFGVKFTVKVYMQ